MQIRRATSDDAATLTDIAFAAKRNWRYPERWIECWRDALTITPEFIEEQETWSVIVEGRIVGFHAIVRRGDMIDLLHLWVRPHAMGRGVGGTLFRHALERMRALGCSRVVIESDPNAEGFYRRMGAVRTGVTVGEVEGERRKLPLLVWDSSWRHPQSSTRASLL